MLYNAAKIRPRGCDQSFILLKPKTLFYPSQSIDDIFISFQRVLEGLGEGVTYPAMHAMMSKWVPLTERSRLVSIIQAGAQFGTFISFPVSGVLSAQLGWPSVFYFFGACGLVWFVFWVFFVFNTPSVHPRISQEERDYIENNMAVAPTGENGEKLPPPPLKHIFTSIPMLALTISHMGQNWGFYTLLTEIPTYLSDILHFSLQSVSMKIMRFAKKM